MLQALGGLHWILLIRWHCTVITVNGAINLIQELMNNYHHQVVAPEIFRLCSEQSAMANHHDTVCQVMLAAVSIKIIKLAYRI